MFFRYNKLIKYALRIKKKDVKKVNTLGCITKTLAQATLPHTNPKLPIGTLYSRSTGQLIFSIIPTSPNYGIPYGSIPRLILAWICSEVIKTKKRILFLGKSQSDFLKQINLHNNGRDIARFREQALRLFKSVISIEYNDEKKNNFSSRLLISESSHIFWNTKTRKKKWESSLELSDGFFREIIDASVPIDIRIFHALSKSPLAMDIYTWLVYRIFILQKSKLSSVFISWINLKFQFGVGYPNTNQGFRDFKKRFRLRLKEVLFFYKKAKRHVRENKIGLIITSCDLHISKLNSKNKND